MVNAVTHTEAVRIRAILEDTLEKLSFLSLVTPDVAEKGDEMAALVGEEVSATIAAQRTLEAEYADLITQAAALKGHANKARLREVQQRLDQVTAALRNGMRSLCRALAENPDVGDSLAKAAEERADLSTLLERTFGELDDGHYHTLAEHVRQDAEARQRVSAVARREEETTREVAALTATLKEEDDVHAVEVEARRADITALKDKLRKLKQDTAATIRYARREITAGTEAGGTAFSQEERVLQAQLEVLRAKLAAEQASHDSSFDLLKREQDELARLAESWRARHAAEVAARADELRKITAAREAQAAELAPLQARYEKDLQVMAEKEAEAERVAVERAVLKNRENAERKAALGLVRVLGPMWAVVSAVRKAAEEEKAKAKGGGKKK